MALNQIIGIDLGTTFSVVAVTDGDHVTIVENDSGNRLTPSCVAFTDDGILVGDPAIEHKAFDPRNTVYGIKRIIGRSYDDQSVEGDISVWPFVVNDQNGIPIINVELQENEKRYKPEEISAIVLKEMKAVAQKHLGDKVTIEKAVITIPAYFNNVQRTATLRAAELAGLEVVRLLHEPTAAAIAYGIESGTYGKQTVLVYDLGGGTFDVSILEIQSDDYKVVGIKGDTHLGGDDFDNNMMDWFKEEFEKDKNRKISEYDLDNEYNIQAMAEVAQKITKAKHALSKKPKTTLIERFLGDEKVKKVIYRATFNDLNRRLFEKTISIVRGLLEEKNLSKNDIDHVVLVGGSTRIPEIQELLRKEFGNIPIERKVHPDEAVAYGAAIVAATKMGTLIKHAGLKFSDVIPLSIGTGGLGDKMFVVLERNSTVPVKGTVSFVNACDQQPAMSFEIVEGESIISTENTTLGNLSINIPKMPPGEARVLLLFEIDENGVLTVTATETSTQKTVSTAVKDRRGTLTEIQLDNMLTRAKKNKAKDENTLRKLIAKANLDVLATNYRSFADRGLFPSKKADVTQKCTEVLNWISAQTNVLEESEYERRQEELEAQFEQFLEN